MASYFAVTTDEGIQFAGKFESKRAALTSVIGDDAVEEFHDAATIDAAVGGLGPRKREAQAQFKVLAQAREERLAEETKTQKEVDRKLEIANCEPESMILKALREIVSDYEEAKATLLRNVERDPSYAVERGEDMIAAAYRWEKARPALLAVEEESWNPVKAYREMLDEVRREVMSNYHRHNSICPFKNAVSEIKRETACKMLDSVRSWGMFQADHRDKARVDLGLEAIDYDATWTESLETAQAVN